MLTPDEISSASETLTAATRAVVITLVRQFSGYSPNLFPDLETTVDAATTIQIQQLNVLVDKLNDVGTGSTKLQGGKKAVNYDQTRDRDELLRAILAVLYDAPVIKHFGRFDSVQGTGEVYDYFNETYRPL